MKNRYTLSVILLLTLSSCEAVEAVFKGGMWFGIILVVFIIGLIGFLFSRSRNK